LLISTSSGGGGCAFGAGVPGDSDEALGGGDKPYQEIVK
jgi:hypothetical protein